MDSLDSYGCFSNVKHGLLEWSTLTSMALHHLNHTHILYADIFQNSWQKDSCRRSTNSHSFSHNVSLTLSRLKHKANTLPQILSRPCTSEAADFDGVERSSLQAWISWVDGSFPLAQTAWELELVGGEDEANQVAQQPPAIFLGGVDSFVPLLVGDVQRVVLQQLLTALQGRGGGEQEMKWREGVQVFQHL